MLDLLVFKYNHPNATCTQIVMAALTCSTATIVGTESLSLMEAELFVRTFDPEKPHSFIIMSEEAKQYVKLYNLYSSIVE